MSSLKPICPKCEHTEFATDVVETQQQKKVEVLFCTKCGVIVGCLPSIDHDHALEMLRKLDIQY
jgi:transcription elongation factor Elf1